MARFFLLILSLSVSLFITATATATVTASAESMRGAGKVTYVLGDAYVIRGSKRTPLSAGDILFSSDMLVTGYRGRIRLQMHDGSKVHLGRLSRISVSNYTLKKGSLISGAFNMLWGKARFFVTKLSKGSGFRVTTGTAVLGVRGTEFLVVIPIPGGITDPTAIHLPPDVPVEVTTVIGVEGLVVGLSLSGERVNISPGVTVEFTKDGKLIFRFSEKPAISGATPGGAPKIPDVPNPADLRPPQLPANLKRPPGQGVP